MPTSSATTTTPTTVSTESPHLTSYPFSSEKLPGVIHSRWMGKALSLTAAAMVVVGATAYVRMHIVHVGERMCICASGMRVPWPVSVLVVSGTTCASSASASTTVAMAIPVLMTGNGRGKHTEQYKTRVGVGGLSLGR